MGAGGASAPPNFDRSVNPISTMGGGRLCPPQYYQVPDPPGFSDLATGLQCIKSSGQKSKLYSNNHMIINSHCFLKLLFIKEIIKSFHKSNLYSVIYLFFIVLELRSQNINQKICETIHLKKKMKFK